MVGQKE